MELTLPPGGIIGVIGPNGAGKTTLFRMITGQDKPDAGTLELGPSVVMAYVDQSRESLVADQTVYQEITGGEDEIPFGKQKINSRSYVSRFGFRGTNQQKSASASPRRRTQPRAPAKTLNKAANLLLGEPATT
jgi:ATPase subunit of ABC transporter with duplicated ATPase domains